MKSIATAKAKHGPVKLTLTKYAATRLAVWTHRQMRRNDSAIAAIHDALRAVVDTDMVDQLADSEWDRLPVPNVDHDAYGEAVSMFYESLKGQTTGQAFRYGLEEYLRLTRVPINTP